MDTEDKKSPIYKRIILKITGEAFSQGNIPLSDHAVEKIVDEIETVRNLGVQMGIVVGAGNIFRGRDHPNIDITLAHFIGMVATASNALFLQGVLEKRNFAARTQTAIEMRDVAEPFIYRRAIRHMEKGRIVVLGGGSGRPFFSTDSAAMLYSQALNADALFKGTKVDGLYTHDPIRKKELAKLISEISYQEAQKLNLTNIIDNAALGLVIDATNKIPLHIFNIFQEGNLRRILLGEKIGSVIRG